MLSPAYQNPDRRGRAEVTRGDRDDQDGERLIKHTDIHLRIRTLIAEGSVYGQGAQHRFLGPMCCDVHKRHSPSRAHIWGGGESGLDPRGVPVAAPCRLDP